MNKLTKPVSTVLKRACITQNRMLPLLTISHQQHQRRWFASGDHTKKEEFASQDAAPHLYDPQYVPCEESDFDVDPLDVRLRQPLPKECFLPRDEVLIRMIAVLEGMERCKTDNITITENTHLANDLGLDSLDQVEFGLAVEDEFDVEIPDEEADQIVTVGDAVELIADHPHAR